MAANKLILNEEKTSTVVFNLIKSIHQFENPTFLGITLDPSSNWQPHIIGLKKKLRKSVFAIKRLCGELDRDGLRQVYFGIFQSHLA